MKATPIRRQIELFVSMCALDNKLDRIIAAMPAFTVSDALMENIKSYAMAVLLSAKVSAYKGSIPHDHVMAIIQQQRLNIPDNLNSDHYAQKEIKTAIQLELTQAHSKIKKELKISITKDYSIFALAMRVVTNTQCSVNVPLCARLALLCKVYEGNKTSKYWDAVNTWLKLVRDTANNDAAMITMAFTNILKADHAMYTKTSVYSIATDSDAWQESVDQVIVGASA
ncbi:hypothetical protein H0H81_001869 [Sphagnurus paluster]|uniref:Uncharacterized protein n=1 Tax=Sphagnurus paluster TaxID=117069 RepID=A0A9P7GFW3_9AGAR|nr:hypothetical protein H0H81_001869 [Sphagnurus paluster]